MVRLRFTSERYASNGTGHTNINDELDIKSLLCSFRATVVSIASCTVSVYAKRFKTQNELPQSFLGHTTGI